MSILETQQSFLRESNINIPVESQFSGSTEFILITDHQTSKEKSLENIQNEKSCCEKLSTNLFRKKTLFRIFPILEWLPKYTKKDAIGDMIAGLTVALTTIPQGLAYAGVAGLPTEYGLYGSFMGCFVYLFMGTCKANTIGSTAIASLLIFQIAEGIWQRAVLLTFLTGIIEIFMAIFKLGFVVDFVSGPVSAGFTSAVSLIIFTSQMKYVLGVKNNGTTFVERWISMLNDIHNTRINDLLLGTGCITLLLCLRFLGKLQIGPQNKNERSSFQNIVNKLIWFLGITRNASVVIGVTTWCYYLHEQGNNLFRLTGYIPSGLPTFKLPPFSIEHVPGNVTAEIIEIKGETFFEMVNKMGSGLIVVPLIALLENVAVCKAFARGKPIDTTQEILTVGVTNILTSFCQGYRGNGGLARSAVNLASGAATQMSNFYIGSVVMFALIYLTDFFYFIPKAALASTIITAIIFQIQYQVIIPMWRSKRTDLIPGFIAFIACLIMPLEIGIMLAIGINLLFILYHSARPKVSLETLQTRNGIQFLKLTPDRCLIFPSVEFVRNVILKSGMKTMLPVVIDCTYIYSADYTAAKAISSMIVDFEKREQKLIFFNLKPSVVHIFEGLNTKLVICYNIHTLTQELKDGSSLNKVEVNTIESESTSSTISLSKL